MGNTLYEKANRALVLRVIYANRRALDILKNMINLSLYHSMGSWLNHKVNCLLHNSLFLLY